jgi:LPXTG-motif cell wall-anchored protein
MTATETKAFQVIDVDGNDLVVKLPEGTKRLTVADDFRFTVDGQQLSVHELKPGMKGTAVVTTTTTTTPVTVTEVKNGTVMQGGGNSIIVRTDQGIKMFSQSDVEKRGVKILKDGQPAQLSDFHEGDHLSATIITTKPPRVMTEKQVQATLARSAAAAGDAASAAMRSATASTDSPSSSAGTSGTSTSSGGGSSRAHRLPKTASATPLIGLIGVLSLAIGLALTIVRRRLIG